MVDTKTQRNKSDKDTIIDMEPVKEPQKISFFKTNNFLVPLISILFFLLISIWLILFYLPAFFQEQTNRINELANIIQKIDEKESEKINILNQEIELLRNRIKKIDLSTNEETKFDIKDLQKSFLFVKEELEKVSTKLFVLEKDNKQVFIKKDEPTNKVLGIITVGSDLVSVECRENFIGWSEHHKHHLKKLNHTAVVSSIVPTQPLGYNMLGGKLVAPVTALFTFFADLNGFKSTIDSVGESWNGPTERVGAGNEIVIKGEVVCKDVIVKFENSNALNGLTLKVPARSKVAVVGPSGSGKTTFLRLCQGFLRPNTGLMEIDGQNIRYLSLDNYRSQNTLIDGKPVFFGATIEENLRKVQPNISEREFQEILEISGLQKVLEQLPEGISTEINQFGMPLSQGDRVTLALARGLIAMPRILLIDEALANLDKSTQISFFENFSKISELKTVIMAVSYTHLTLPTKRIV